MPWPCPRSSSSSEWALAWRGCGRARKPIQPSKVRVQSSQRRHHSGSGRQHLTCMFCSPGAALTWVLASCLRAEKPTGFAGRGTFKDPQLAYEPEIASAVAQQSSSAWELTPSQRSLLPPPQELLSLPCPLFQACPQAYERCCVKSMHRAPAGSLGGKR